MGYISQATLTLITTNNANDHRVYLIQFDPVRCVRHASAMETNKANNSMMPKWLRFNRAIVKRSVSTQFLRPDAISSTSKIASTFTTPAAAINRVP
jgi:hypothetical protein